MSLSPTFRRYRAGDQPACLDLFDANCPAFFAAGERLGYIEFLSPVPEGYEVCVDGSRIVGAYGIRPRVSDEAVIRWILIAPDFQGRGIGAAMMTRALTIAHAGSDRAMRQKAAEPISVRAGRSIPRRSRREPSGHGAREVDRKRR